jgi:hypothetical protein
MRNDCYKLTPSVETPIFTTTPKDAIFTEYEPRDVIGRDVGKVTPNVETLFAVTSYTNCK